MHWVQVRCALTQMLKGYGLGDGRVDVESRGEGELCKVTTLCVKEMYVGAALAI